MSVGEKVLKRAIQVPPIDVESDVWALRSGTGLGVGECKFRLNVVQPTTNPGVPRCVPPPPPFRNRVSGLGKARPSSVVLWDL